MKESTNSRLASRGVLWRSGLCLLLAVLFLYSPFFTIYGSSHVLKVQQTPSYRGTIAASELRRFTVSSLQISLGSPEQTIDAGLVIPVIASSFGYEPKLGHLPFHQQDFLSNSWFRPPPGL